jgi:hypothetical protein
VSGRAAEVAWIDAHVERTGDVEEVRARPWATVLRAPTASPVPASLDHNDLHDAAAQQLATLLEESFV